jgi:hypothetical protein
MLRYDDKRDYLVWVKRLALSGPGRTRGGGCELRGWTVELHRALGSLRVQGFRLSLEVVTEVSSALNEFVRVLWVRREGKQR